MFLCVFDCTADTGNATLVQGLSTQNFLNIGPTICNIVSLLTFLPVSQFWSVVSLVQTSHKPTRINDKISQQTKVDLGGNVRKLLIHELRLKINFHDRINHHFSTFMDVSSLKYHTIKRFRSLQWTHICPHSFGSSQMHQAKRNKYIHVMKKGSSVNVCITIVC